MENKIQKSVASHIFLAINFQTIGYLPFLPISIKACKPVVKELSWEESNELVERMQKERLERGLTYNKFAKLIGVTGSTDWNWEHGKNRVKKMYLKYIENVIT